MNKFGDFSMIEFVTHICAVVILPQIQEFVKHMHDDQVRDVWILESAVL